jgi:hypothetical protein
LPHLSDHGIHRIDGKGYSTDVAGNVVLRMTPGDHSQLLLMVGLAVGVATNQDPDLKRSFLALANRLNHGNPRWTPFELQTVTVLVEQSDL